MLGEQSSEDIVSLSMELRTCAGAGRLQAVGQACPAVFFFFNGLLAQKGFFIFFELKKFLIKDIL